MWVWRPAGLYTGGFKQKHLNRAGGCPDPFEAGYLFEGGLAVHDVLSFSLISNFDNNFI